MKLKEKAETKGVKIYSKRICTAKISMRKPGRDFGI